MTTVTDRAPVEGPAAGTTGLSWAANDFALSPTLEDFLRRAGLGSLSGSEVRSLPGRNSVWLGRTSTGREVFVKQTLGGSAAERVRHQEVFDRLATQAWAPQDRPSPALLASSPEHGLLAYEAVHGRDGASLVVEEQVDERLAAELGTILARVHTLPPHLAAEVPRPHRRPFPAVDVLRAVPPEAFEVMSFADIQVLQLLQADQELIEALLGLHRLAAQAPTTPVHGDLRMDQVLVADGRTYLTDWEDFQVADPARDVGGFVGEWLYRAVLDVVTDRGGLPTPTGVLSHHEVLVRATGSIAAVVPLVRAFWRAYLEQGARVDPGFPARATMYAGWHTIDRLFASASRASRLRAVERAAAGIGRRAVLTPERFAPHLGLEVA